MQRNLPGDSAMQELIDVIGEGPALALARRYGGTRLHVPRMVGEHHHIRAVLGDEATERLAAWAGGGAVDVPKQAAKRTRVKQLHAQRALTISQIALETDYSERHVYRLISQVADDRQASLFDD